MLVTIQSGGRSTHSHSEPEPLAGSTRRASLQSGKSSSSAASHPVAQSLAPSADNSTELTKTSARTTIVAGDLTKELTMPSARTTIVAGNLTKMGNIAKNWKTRYFILDTAAKLSYYKSEPAKKAEVPTGTRQGVIDMASVAGVWQCSELTCEWPKDANRECCFGIVTPGRTYYVRCFFS